MKKRPTKAELETALLQANDRADGLQAQLDGLSALINTADPFCDAVTLRRLGKMLKVDRDTLIEQINRGMPAFKAPKAADEGYKLCLSDVVKWLQAESRRLGNMDATDAEFPKWNAENTALREQVKSLEHEISNRRMAEDLLLAEISGLKSELFQLQDDSVPPALPQPVIDAMDDAAEFVREQIDILHANHAVPGRAFDVDDPDHAEARDAIVRLSSLDFRLRECVDEDFEHHNEKRMEAINQRLATSVQGGWRETPKH